MTPLAFFVDVTKTATAGDLLVGFGTLVLAGFTYWLGRQARSEGSQVATQVELERRRMDVEARPYVVPAPSPEWSNGSRTYDSEEWKRLLPVKNVGPGGALNVQGELDFRPPSGVKVSLIPTSVGSGEREDLRVHWDGPTRDDWKVVDGSLDYEDVNGGSWRTEFQIEERGEVRYIRVRDVLPLEQAGDTAAGAARKATNLAGRPRRVTGS